MLQGSFALIFLIILFHIFKLQKQDLDLSVCFSLVTLFILNLLVNFIKKSVSNLIEDDIKLDSDYENLNRYYINDKFKFTNINIKKGNKEYVYPILLDSDLRNKKIIINDSKNMYALPNFVSNNYEELMTSHSSSYVYNQLNIRIKNWYEKDDTFIMDTERTTYFNSLVTNRSVDFKLKQGLSIRDVLCYGPYLPSLETSSLSNHIGINGLVETKDGFFPLIKRMENLSIGKRTYGLSIGASIKTKYALDSNGIFYYDKLIYSIKQEVCDELRTSIDRIINEEQSCMYAAYRDLVEGGKPQLFVYFKLLDTKDDLTKKIKTHRKQNKKTTIIDGYKILWIKKDKTIPQSGVRVFPNKFIYTKEKCLLKLPHKMVPSASACLGFAINFGLL